jgi:hypothetical protein
MSTNKDPDYNRIKQAEWRQRTLDDPEAKALFYAKKRVQNQVRYANGKANKSKEANRKYAKTLTNAYVAMTMGVGVKDIPVQLLEVKRQILTLKRTLKGTAKNEQSATAD